MKTGECFKIARLKLTVATPVFIGSRQGTLYPMEYFFHNNRVYVVDEEKLGRFLLQRNLMDEFVRAAFSGELKSKGILALLQNATGDNLPDLNSLSSYSIPGGKSNMGEFRPFIRDGLGKIYIPGTSIKGVLRTAVLYNAIKNDNPRLWEGNVEKRIKKGEINTKRARKEFSANIQREFLQSFSISPGKIKDQNRDIFRCLTVRDAYPTEKLKTQVIPIKVLCKNKNGVFYWGSSPRRNRELTIWIEAIISGIFETEIIWDNALYRRFANTGKKPPVNNIKDILECVVQMNADVMKQELHFFTKTPGRNHRSEGHVANTLRSWYEDAVNDSWLRIGYGSGMLSTTVNLLWKEKLRQEIRNICGKNRGDDPAPKSRRIWQKSDFECFPIGWMKLEICYEKSSGKWETIEPKNKVDIKAYKKDSKSAGTVRNGTSKKSPIKDSSSLKVPLGDFFTAASASKPVQKGQTRQGTLVRDDNRWKARFEGESRLADIENPGKIPDNVKSGSMAEFYIVAQSKKKGIIARFQRLLNKPK